MAIISEVSNGLLTGAKSVESIEKKNADDAKTTESTNDDNRNMFLQLLVTEMKYQDPMQPSDNSEYVKQMATFSQVEAVQNVQSDMDEMRAASMVGKYVSITDEEGNVKEGKVDYTTKVSGEIKVSVEGELYNMTSVSGVYENDFYEAGVAADTINDMLENLPPVGQITILDEDKITSVANLFNSMDAYQQSFLSDETKNTVKTYVNRLNELLDNVKSTTEDTTDTTEAAESAATTQTETASAGQEENAAENDTQTDEENSSENQTV
ncbi:MAG: hypothetical protein K6F00_08235 [Lachnospiraceae bacterium]|nr:hypothetical protein [Lachnospiraceae bacterium]